MKNFECRLCKCNISIEFNSKYDKFDSELSKMICLNCWEVGNLVRINE